MSQPQSNASATATSVRAHETRTVIDAPIEEVWKAITEARRIARWFAPKMTVEPGAGGFMLADWGPGLEWKTAIEIWEPNRRLRLVETRDRALSAEAVEIALEPCRLVQDYYLEAEGGKTVLRLVHSGFGSSTDWDNEFEGTREGWASCFVRLKQGLERHQNDSVRNLFVSAVCHGLDAPHALVLIESVLPQPLNVVLRGDLHICALLPELNGSVLTISVQPAPTGSVAYTELVLYAVADAAAAAIENDWKTKLARLFPPPAGGPPA